jgi:hypothetical protein
MSPSSALHHVSLLALMTAALAGVPTPSQAETAKAHASPSSALLARDRLLVLAGRGELRATPSSSWTELTPGMLAPARGEVRTSGESLRFRLSSGTQVELAPNGLIACLGSADLLLRHDDVIVATQIDLRRGELRVDNPFVAGKGARRGAPVLVHGVGPLLALAREGTMRARLLAQEGAVPEGMAVAAYERASVRVAAQGVLKELPAGAMVVLRSGLPTPGAQAQTPGPAWIAETGATSRGPLAIVHDDTTAVPFLLRFAQAPGASGYELEVAKDEAFTHLVTQRALGASETSVLTPPLEPGRYFARVRARAAGGLPGAAGPVRALRVTHLALPPGGSASGALVTVPRDRGVTLDDPEGLELATGSGGFFRALQTIGPITGTDSVSLRIRIAGEPSFVPLTLAPHTVRAEVEIGPKLAHWPTDPVQIHVRLRNKSGASLQFEPINIVSVNLRKVPVTWTREGDSFRAVLAPIAEPGPWVVRVETTDPQGNELGRGFLEIDHAAKR